MNNTKRVSQTDGQVGYIAAAGEASAKSATYVGWKNRAAATKILRSSLKCLLTIFGCVGLLQQSWAASNTCWYNYNASSYNYYTITGRGKSASEAANDYIAQLNAGSNPANCNASPPGGYIHFDAPFESTPTAWGSNFSTCNGPSGTHYFSVSKTTFQCDCDAKHVANPQNGGMCSGLITTAAPSPPQQRCTDPSYGNPIHPLSGVKREYVDTGLSIGGVNLSLTYDSNLMGPFNGSNTAMAPVGSKPFGPLWHLSLDHSLSISVGAIKILLSLGDGKIMGFNREASGLYTSDSVLAHTLVTVPGGYRYTNVNSGEQEIFDANGSLLSITKSNGITLSFSYSGGNLVQISSSEGRSVSFTYNAGNLVTSITDAAGATITPAYDAKSNLVALTWPDGKTARFLYEDTANPAALTGKVDENNVRYATFTYGAWGRVLSTEYAGGVGKYSASYNGSQPFVYAIDTYNAAENNVYRSFVLNTPSAGARVAAPNGQTVSVGATAVRGAPAVTSVSQPAGSGCAASSSAVSYDGNGNIASTDDFGGMRTCFGNDMVRNLPLVSVAGLNVYTTCSTVTPANATLPAGSRKTTKQYHPDWALVSKVASPVSLTTHVYNGQPDPFNGGSVASCAPSNAVLPDGKPIAVLCKSVEQATTDANGSLGLGATVNAAFPARITSFTYDAFGRVLTSADPLGGVTSYAYYADTSFGSSDPAALGHTVGDLQSVTNAAGHVTQFTQYDRAGRVRQKIDPKGVVTDTTYTPRGWVSTVTETPPGGTARTTTYTYDGAGQLTGVAQPDGSALSYSYDAAHRLVGVADAKGNTVTYTLDSEGNRIAEDIKDPSGALQRSISRSFDVLGRLKQSNER